MIKKQKVVFKFEKILRVFKLNNYTHIYSTTLFPIIF